MEYYRTCNSGTNFQDSLTSKDGFSPTPVCDFPIMCCRVGLQYEKNITLPPGCMEGKNSTVTVTCNSGLAQPRRSIRDARRKRPTRALCFVSWFGRSILRGDHHRPRDDTKQPGRREGNKTARYERERGKKKGGVPCKRGGGLKQGG